MAIEYYEAVCGALRDVQSFWMAVADDIGEPRRAATVVAGLLDGTRLDAMLARDSLALLEVPELVEVLQRDVLVPLELLLIDKATQTLASRFRPKDIDRAYTVARNEALASLIASLTEAMVARYQTLEIDDADDDIDSEDDEYDDDYEDEIDDEDDDDDDDDDDKEASTQQTASAGDDDDEEESGTGTHETLDDSTFEAIRARLEANKRQRRGD